MSSRIKSISSEIKTLRSIFKNNDIFSIPDFQRDFVWGRSEINKLFEDFSEDTNGFDDISSEGYLLGNIVIIKDDTNDISKKEVIDGQQRLTVLSLLFYSLKNLIDDIQTDIKKDADPLNLERVIEEIQSWSKIGTELDMGYLVKLNNTTHLKIKHDKSLLRGEDYRNFFTDVVKDDNLNVVKPETEESEIEQIYNIIDEKVHEIYNGDNGEQRIENFINYLKDDVYLIETSATSLAKAFQLFEVLNQRGVGLTPLDLIKNLLLKRLVETKEKDQFIRNQIIKDRRQKFGSLWLNFVSRLEFKEDLRRNPINSSTFLKQFLIGTKGEKLTDKKLFDYFSNIKLAPEEVITLIQDFISIVNIYREIERGIYDKFTTDSHSKLIMRLLFNSFGNKQIHSLLIPFYNKNEELKIRVLNHAVRLVAAINYADGSPSALETIIANANKILLSKTDFELNKYFEYIQKEITEYASKAKAVIEVNKYATRSGKPNNKSKNLFKFIEVVAHNQNPFSQKGKMRGKKTTTIEHIMPQKLEQSKYHLYYINDHTEHQEYLNRIGNLTLIDQSYNSAMQNKKYGDKKDFFANTNFLTTKSIAHEINPLTKTGHRYKTESTANDYLYEDTLTEGDYWDIEKIKTRSKRIAEYLEYILVTEL